MNDSDRIQVVATALGCGGTASQKLLLVHLALMVDERGELRTSIADLARRLGMDRGALQRLFPWLEHADLLTIDRSSQPFVLRLPGIVTPGGRQAA